MTSIGRAKTTRPDTMTIIVKKEVKGEKEEEKEDGKGYGKERERKKSEEMNVIKSLITIEIMMKMVILAGTMVAALAR